FESDRRSGGGHMKRIVLTTIAIVFWCLLPTFAQQEMTTLRQKANAGDPAAQVKIGNMYAMGQGVVRNSQEAVKWFRKAADQGYADGEYRLGGMYDVGFGVAQDSGTAIKWYQLAANQGLVDA